MMTGKRIFTGIQPTGKWHIGNFFGALKQMIALQNDNQCILSIVDLHALTSDKQNFDLSETCLQSAAMAIACGIDPNKTILFRQSSISQHSELLWYLMCFGTSHARLGGMIQWKQKGKGNPGLFTYPVLQAADILLYDAHLVPVGMDQKQHLELTADIARKVNSFLNEDLFKIPCAMIDPKLKTIKSLRDSRNKMSKSDPDYMATIFLNDGTDDIRHKIKKATTDSYNSIAYDPENRPSISSLVDIYSLVSGIPEENVIEKYKNNYGYSEFKQDLGDFIVEFIEPKRILYTKLLGNRKYLSDVLRDGETKARGIAKENFDKIKKKFL